MRICPYDCTPCTDPACRQEGCKEIEAVILETCEGCGEPVDYVNCASLCVVCVDPASAG